MDGALVFLGLTLSAWVLTGALYKVADALMMIAEAIKENAD
jgi:hypothetical protein